MSHTFELGLALGGPALNTKIMEDGRWGVRNPKDQIIHISGGDIEQACDYNARILPASANIVGLAHAAFSDHFHMILDPDSVWMTIERGLAIHIKENAEELRHHFVDFEGKELIHIQRDNFVRGQNNDWEGCFDEFSEKIGEFIGKKRDLIVGNFSTTGLLQRVSSEVILMDSMSKYFDYGMSTCCSIPLVTLEGTVEDWENIRDRVAVFDEFGLGWWTEHLMPVLDQLVATAKGNPDLEFWNSWYKEGGGSGGPYISGHITKLFPYLEKYSGEHYKSKLNYMRAGGFGSGPTLDQFPKGISQVPFVWNYYGNMLPMEFVGGVIGVQQQDDGAVRAAHGWAVRDESVPLDNYPLEMMVKGMKISHKNGDVGTLQKMVVEEWDNGSRRIDEFVIQWEQQGKKTHSRYDAHSMFVKETAIDGERMYEGKVKVPKMFGEEPKEDK